jgi:anti-sigma B factor antagonist
MDFEVKEAGDITVVAPRGDVDMAVADQVRQRLTGLVDVGHPRLVLDLGSVAYIDTAMKHARAAGGDLKVCRIDQDLRPIFEMTRLNKIMAIHGTREEALAAWG